MTEGALPGKSAGAYRTIGEVAEELKLPQHVLRFWETRFAQVKPLKRAGGRRFYRPEDMALLAAIKLLLYTEGYTIKGVQRLLRDQGPYAVALAAGAGRASPDIDHREDAPVTRDDPKLSASRPPRVPARLPSAPAAPPPAPEAPARDIVARLRGVVVELAECGRILAALRD